MLETLQVAFLAPAATAGAISLEREKQTLDMLVATPISSVAIVVGKLLSALVYVLLLIAASIPLTAVVFVFGGVAPDDVLRGYVVLIVTALGLGAFGLFCSSLVKRTQAATAITIFGVLVDLDRHRLRARLLGRDGDRTTTNDGIGPVRGSAPQEIAYRQPVPRRRSTSCAAPRRPCGGWCSLESSLLPNQSGVVFVNGGVGDGGPIVGAGRRRCPIGRRKGGGHRPGGQGSPTTSPCRPTWHPFGVDRDAFWPQSVVAWLILSVIFLLLSVQFVSPTRRWRLRRGRRRRRGTSHEGPASRRIRARGSGRSRSGAAYDPARPAATTRRSARSRAARAAGRTAAPSAPAVAPADRATDLDRSRRRSSVAELGAVDPRAARAARRARR